MIFKKIIHISKSNCKNKYVHHCDKKLVHLL